MFAKREVQLEESVGSGGLFFFFSSPFYRKEIISMQPFGED